MDILRVLSSPDLEVRKKTLQLVLDLVTSRNIHEVWERLKYKPDPWPCAPCAYEPVLSLRTKKWKMNFQVVAVLKKEVIKTHNDSEQEEIGGYRQVCTHMIIYTK